MDHNYYDELISSIEALIKEQSYMQAKQLLDTELAMPYIPLAAEKRLQELVREVAYHTSSDKGSSLLTIEQFEAMMQQDETIQLAAIKKLESMNIRPFMPIIQQVLMNDPNRLIGSLLIDMCIQQGIQETLRYNIEGKQYEFIPIYIERPMETDGVVVALKQLQQWFENDNPSLMMMCIEALMQDAYLKLPESYSEEEGELLAMTIALALFNNLGDMDGKERFINQYQLDPRKKIDIMLELALDT